MVEHCGGGGGRGYASGCSEGENVRCQAAPGYGDLWGETFKGDV